LGALQRATYNTDEAWCKSEANCGSEEGDVQICIHLHGILKAEDEWDY